jgi:hypothetical protein
VTVGDARILSDDHGARRCSDEAALDAIALELAEPDWSPDTVMRIDAIVRLTGRNAESR